MTILKVVIKTIIVLLLLANLSGCNITGLKETEEAPKIDLLALKEEADFAYLNNDMVISEKNYSILVKEMPVEALFWFRLANVYVRTNRPDAAITLYREAVIRDPEFSKAWYNLGIVQLNKRHSVLMKCLFIRIEMILYTVKQQPCWKRLKTSLKNNQA